MHCDALPTQAALSRTRISHFATSVRSTAAAYEPIQGCTVLSVNFKSGRVGHETVRDVECIQAAFLELT